MLARLSAPRATIISIDLPGANSGGTEQHPLFPLSRVRQGVQRMHLILAILIQKQFPPESNTSPSPSTSFSLMATILTRESNTIFSLILRSLQRWNCSLS